MTTKAKTSQKYVPLVKKLEIHNFGPISSGTVELKPLTIFVGPNSSGKSYVAELIYAIYKAHEYKPKTFWEFFEKINPIYFSVYQDVLRKIIKHKKTRQMLQNILKELKEMGQAKAPHELIERINDAIVKEIFEINFKKELKRIFAVNNTRILVRNGAQNASITIYQNTKLELALPGKKKLVRQFTPKDIEVILEITDSMTEPLDGKIEQDPNKPGRIKVIISKSTLHPDKTPGDLPKKMYDRLLLEYIGASIIEICGENITGEIGIGRCYYLPAARSGITEAHRTLAAALLETINYAGIGKIEIPQLRGAAADIVSQILRINYNTQTEFAQIAENFEKKMIRGTITFRRIGKKSAQEPVYVSGDLVLPLHLTSSAILEIAPLILYLKHIVRKGSTLIIEEPEAHLHPKNQRILAELIVNLVRRGIYVLITTHSEYIISQINNFIKLSQLSPEAREEEGYSKNTYLLPDEVAAYLFKQSNESEGYEIVPLEITPEEGIPQDTFAEVYRELYEESYWLDEKIEHVKGHKV